MLCPSVRMGTLWFRSRDSSFEGAQHFSWMKKPKDYIIEYSVEKSGEYINSVVANQINCDELFDELTLLNAALKKMKERSTRKKIEVLTSMR